MVGRYENKLVWRQEKQAERSHFNPEDKAEEAN